MKVTKNYNVNNGDTTVIEGELIIKGALKVEGGEVEGIEATGDPYVHPSTPGNKHIPAGGSSGQVLTHKADGEAQWSALPQATTGAFGVVKKGVAVADSTAEDVATIKNNFNSLLASLRNAGIIENS